jgi:hypothetical protein
MNLMSQIFTLVDIPDAFRNRIESDEFLEFNRRLRQIKAEPSALVRVKEVYELISFYKKPYDVDYASAIKSRGKLKNRPLILNPEETLQYGGVCRDFARLLKWALMQVARSSSPDPESQVFSTAIKIGKGEDGLGHMWVRVNVPLVNPINKLSRFQGIELDITNFAGNFTPLPPFGSHWTQMQMQSDLQQCQKIISCLNEQSPSKN